MSTLEAPEVAPPEAKTERDARASVLRHLPKIVIGAVIVAVVIGMVLTPAFLTQSNIRAVFQSAAITGIVAVTMTPMAISGNFVSLGSQQSTVLAAMGFLYLLAQGVSPVVAIALVLALLVVIGLAQGVVVALGLNAVITTLAFGVIVIGILERLNAGRPDVKAGADAVGWGTASFFGISIQVVVLGVITAILTLVMSKTSVGREVTLCGANPAAAKLSGISVSAITVGVFVLASAGCGVAGILGGAQFGQSGTGDYAELTFAAASAILIGGTSIAGGVGSPLRSAVGAIIISVIASLMTLNSFTPGIRGIVEGSLVIGVVIAVETARRQRTTR